MRQPPSIDAWGGGGFRISGAWQPGSLLLLDDAPRSWRPVVMSDISLDDLNEIIAAGTDVSEFVLLGTGLIQALPPPSVREAVRAAGLGLEFMSTEAAVRMYNVLASEGRRFAAALIAV